MAYIGHYKSPIIYISGPISDPIFRLALRNLSRFFYAEAELLVRRFAPVNPAADIMALMHCPESFFEEDDTWWLTLMGKDESLVKSSHGVYLLPGWQQSEGAAQEFFWACEAGIPTDERIDTICLKALEFSLGEVKARGTA